MRRSAVPLGLSAVAATAVALVVGTVGVSPAVSAVPAGGAGFAGVNGTVTGGEGGARVRATTGTQIHQALCGRASNSTPIVIEVEGTINHGNTTKVSGSCNTAADKIEIKDVSNISIVGVGSGAVFDQLGIHLRNASNVIIQNVTVQNVKKSGSPVSNGGDAIGMETDVHHVWVDHATLVASGGESAGYDGLFDLKDNTTYVTLSYSVLRNSGRGGLVGSSDSDLGNGPVTYHHNLYQNIDSRTPLLRGATAHIYNNHYLGINESGINPRAGGRARVENNYFEDSKDVLGTFYTDLAGYWQTSGNILDNVTWSAAGSDTNPAGPSMASNATVSIPYSYGLDAASCVPSVVSAAAGANKGLRVSNGSCSTTSQTSSSSSTTRTTTSSSTTRTTTTSTRTTTTTSTRTSTTTTSSTTGGTGSCTAAYAVTSSWSGGFVANVDVTAGGAAINGWRVTLTLPGGTTLVGVWNGVNSGTTGTVTVTNASYNGRLAAGQATSFGFQGNGSGSGVTVSCTAV